MAYLVVETIQSACGTKRVLIVQRKDGRYSVKTQSQDDGNYKGPGRQVWGDDWVHEAGWNPPGLDIGIYDSAETAKWEALCRIEWLAEVIKPN